MKSNLILPAVSAYRQCDRLRLCNPGIGFLAGLCIAAPLASVDAQETGSPRLEEVIVTATLREAPALELPASVTVLDRPILREAGVQHFEDVLPLVPNLSWSGATSRPRYFQLRGIGELEQYQGAPNPSIGLLIDEIDFSGVGMPATLFDLQQIEVLRGPQGTRYGANALAGLIKLKTRDPTEQLEIDTEITTAEDDMFGAGVALGGPLTASASGRLALQRTRSDGFRRNVYLGRDDTNERDELTARAKLRLQPGDVWRIDLTALHVDLDNGFDAFTIDNSLTMRSDRPGRDAQRSTGASMVVRRSGADVDWQSTTAWADSAIEYSFDGDWGNDPFWGPFAPYDYYSRYLRDRQTISQDLRWLSASPGERSARVSWVTGLYVLDLSESNDQLDLFVTDPFRALVSDYDATNVAVYGQAELALGDRNTLSVGLRAERRDARYRDSDGTRFDPTEDMWGGSITLSRELDSDTTAYIGLSRGYKAGGFNIGELIPDERRSFAAEYLWNLESGVKGSWLQDRLYGSLTVFYSRREDQQVASSFQLDPGDPLSYVFYTDNAARGENYGLEGSVRFVPSERWELSGTLGLLDTRYIDYRYGERDLDGREQAHAPGYQYSLSASYRQPRGFFARVDLGGVDAFYFDTSHDQRSQAYTLVNGRIGYEAGRWSVHLWGRNLFDEAYAVRGFYFGLEPPDFANKLYIQRGDPRQFGVTVRYAFQ